MKARVVASVLLGMALPCAVAHAQEVAAGWEGDDQRGYAFASPSTGIMIGQSQALVLRLSGSYLYYGYPEDAGRVTVQSPGVGGAVGYRVQSRSISATMVAGFELRNNMRTARGITSSSLQQGPYAAAEIFASAGALNRISTIANYGRVDRYLWARSSFSRQLTNRRFEKSRAIGAGVDITVAGNRDLQTQQLGGVLVWDWFRVKGSLQLRAGYSRSLSAGSSVDHRPYIGFGIYHHF
jgi:cellulose biosynthesis protein BcsS